MTVERRGFLRRCFDRTAATPPVVGIPVADIGTGRIEATCATCGTTLAWERGRCFPPLGQPELVHGDGDTPWLVSNHQLRWPPYPTNWPEPQPFADEEPV